MSLNIGCDIPTRRGGIRFARAKASPIPLSKFCRFSIKIVVYFLSLVAINTQAQNLEIKQKLEALEERVSSNEDYMIDIDERVGSRTLARAFDGARFDIGGFVHTAFTHVEGEDGNVNGFNRQNFELLIGADLDDNWSTFFAGGFLRESDDPFVVGDRNNPGFNHVAKNPQIIAWVNYRSSAAFNVRIGRMITPHDSINIEHFPATLIDPEQPQMLRPFGGQTIFPNFSTGIQLHGELYYGNKSSFGWSTYVTRHPAVPAEENFGARGQFGFDNDAYLIGLNASKGTRPGNLADYTMSGIDLRIDKNALLLKAAYFTTSEDVGGDRTGAYIQPSWKLSKQWLAFFRYDLLEVGDAPGETTENALGLNFLPSNSVRLRVIVSRRSMDQGDGSNPAAIEADADIVQLSGTFSF